MDDLFAAPFSTDPLCVLQEQENSSDITPASSAAANAKSEVLTVQQIRAGWRYLHNVCAPEALSSFTPMPPDFAGGRVRYAGEFALIVWKQQREKRNV